jgi:hypothetical protein
VKASILKKLRQRKRRIEQRLGQLDVEHYGQPVLRGSNIQYEVADRTRAISAGGIGAMQQMVQQLGLPQAINERLHLLKLYLPYRESDHVLNVAYNLLAGGTRMEHIELRREDEVFLDALGASRIPDPTTARDFCQRFTDEDVLALMEAINETRLVVWGQQPDGFFDEAVIDVDGTIAETSGQCKEGMELAYNGQWGFHPLVVSLANTQEPLYLVNRSGNRPSHEGAAEYLDRAAALCRRAGFRQITYRGDTDFSQTQHLDRWDADGRQFIFGYDAAPNLVRLAENLPETAWKKLVRPTPPAAGPPRQRPENVKQRLVDEHDFETLRTVEEYVAEFDYRPTACRKSYRMVVVRKVQTVQRGQQVLFEKEPFFFYITNQRSPTAEQIVIGPRGANGRCHQENLIEQLKHGVRALDMPTGNLVSNWAYAVMASLAWTLKTWFALLLPEDGRWGARRRAEKETVLRMEFRGFLDAFLHLPCQIIKTSRKIIYRFLAWNRWQEVFFRFLDRLAALDHLHGRRRC